MLEVLVVGGDPFSDPSGSSAFGPIPAPPSIRTGSIPNRLRRTDCQKTGVTLLPVIFLPLVSPLVARACRLFRSIALSAPFRLRVNAILNSQGSMPWCMVNGLFVSTTESPSMGSDRGSDRRKLLH